MGDRVRLLFLGDIVGRSGRTLVIQQLPRLIDSLKLDFVAINAENAAGGFGITEDIALELFEAGADVLTLGNHAFDQRSVLPFLDQDPRIVRPANYPPGTPGRGTPVVAARNGARVLAINLMGRLFMDPLDDPFARLDHELDSCRLGEDVDAILVDFHAEATSEKQGIGALADGRASLVVGTHTHVPTADHRILPGGTAFQTDVGMCGDYDSVIGMDKGEPLNRFLTKLAKERMSPALGPAMMCGVVADLDPGTGLAIRVAPLRVGAGLESTIPGFPG